MDGCFPLRFNKVLFVSEHRPPPPLQKHISKDEGVCRISLFAEGICVSLQAELLSLLSLSNFVGRDWQKMISGWQKSGSAGHTFFSFFFFFPLFCLHLDSVISASFATSFVTCHRYNHLALSCKCCKHQGEWVHRCINVKYNVFMQLSSIGNDCRGCLRDFFPPSSVHFVYDVFFFLICAHHSCLIQKISQFNAWQVSAELMCLRWQTFSYSLLHNHIF